MQDTNEYTSACQVQLANPCAGISSPSEVMDVTDNNSCNIYSGLYCLWWLDFVSIFNMLHIK